MDYKRNNNENQYFFEDEIIFEETETSNTTSEQSGQNPQKNKRPQKTFTAGVYEWLDVVVASIIAVVIIFTFIFRIVSIDGSSMAQTLFDGQRVIITDLFYEPQRGDIVVISRNTDNLSGSGEYAAPIIKRVIAVENDLVDIRNGVVFVNNEKIKEPYLWETPLNKGDVQFPLRVKENCVFVLGDNRNDSLDSRFTAIGDNGQIDKKYILGHAIFRVYPFDDFGGIE